MNITDSEPEILFSKYRPYLEAYAVRYVRDGLIAEDLVSDSFVLFWESRERLDASLNIPSYLFKIVRNKCLNWLRDQTIHTRVANSFASHRERLLQASFQSLSACDPEQLFASEVETIVDKTLQCFPHLTREVFIYSRRHDKSHKEIAEMFGITTKRVDYELQKATKRLRDALRDYIPVWLICACCLHLLK